MPETAPAPGSRPPGGAPGQAVRRRLAGTGLAYICAGAGTPVVALHGISSSADVFVHQLSGLGHRHRVVAWDAPGYGASDDPEAPPGMEGYAAAAARLIEGLDLAPAHVLGVSWGGVIAMTLALGRPDLVRSLIVADSSPGSGTDPERAVAMRRRPSALAAEGPAGMGRRRAPALLSEGADPALVEAVAAMTARAVRLPGFAWAADSMADTDLRDRLGELRVPTLVVVGAEDRICGVDVATGLVDRIPGAVLAVIPGAGHLANLEAPAAFNARVISFLSAVDGGDSPDVRPAETHPTTASTNPERGGHAHAR